MSTALSAARNATEEVPWRFSIRRDQRPCPAVNAESVFMMTRTEDFFQGCHSTECLLQTVFQQRPHAHQARLTADGLGRLALERHLAHRAGHLQHLEDALAPAVARVV